MPITAWSVASTQHESIISVHAHASSRSRMSMRGLDEMGGCPAPAQKRGNSQGERRGEVDAAQVPMPMKVFIDEPLSEKADDGPL